MSRLLISFCNTLPRGFPLAAYDFDSGDLDWMPVPGSARPIGGGTGLCRVNGEYWTLLQHRVPGWPSTLAVYGANAELRTTIELSRVSDAHSMIWYEDALLVASTGTNALVRVALDPSLTVAREEPYWRLGGLRSDQDHVNSVCCLEGKLYACMFGPKPEPGDTVQERDGRIVDIATGEAVFTGLHHPHSLAAIDGTLYCLSSGTGQLWRFQRADFGLHGEVLLELPGYLRGLASDGRYLYIGASARRLRSKSRNRLADQPEGNFGPLHCLLYRVDLASGEAESRDLTPFAREIYELAVLPPEYPRPAPGSSPDAIITRQLAYDQEHLRALEDLRLALEQLEALQMAVR